METSYLSTQVSAIISQLHGLFDEIGLPNHERELKESQLFTALSETLNNQLRLVTTEKSELTEEANQMIKTIKQMKASLEDQSAHDAYSLDDKELKVTIPLIRCLQEIVAAIESYSSHLEPSYVKVALPPVSSNGSLPPMFNLSPPYIASLDKEFSRVYEEYMRRIRNVKGMAEDIVNMWAELGTPQAQTESSIVKHYREAPEQLGLHEDDMKRLKTKRDRLAEEKHARERRLKELKATVEALWERLGVEESDRKRFIAGNRGCGLRAINEFEAELDRLDELKRQNLHLFVEDARYKLQELWDGLYFSEEEMLQFAPAFSEVYSDALLSAHEAEIGRLETLKEQRAPALQMIDQHRSLIKDRDELAAASQDASRLLMKPNKGERRDPTRLLREEKMRKRIAKDLPKVEAQLKKTLERWEEEYGRPFLVHGVPYMEELAAAAAAKNLPPRSKTPSAGQNFATTTKQVPLKSAPAPSSSRAGSVASNVLRGRPGSRSGTVTPGAGTQKRNPMASSVSTATGRTPSRIPARVPLGTTRYGGNSPERRPPPAAETSYDTGTMRKMGPPARAPPPKMRDIFELSKVEDGHNNENIRCASAASSHGSGSVRHITPEDVYDDRERMSYVTTSMMQSSEQNTPQNYRDIQASSRYKPQQYVPTADSRQISTTSTSTAAASGSENWETFDDASEPEVDASREYYAKLRAVKTGKRFTPDGGYTSNREAPGKKFKDAYGNGCQAYSVAQENGNHRMAAGSESAWTDEDAF
ncbi:MAG: hypothetical protein Q9163_001830 [Psora crenata]